MPARKAEQESEELLNLFFAVMGRFREHFFSCVDAEGLTPAQAHALRQLAEPISQRELAGCLGYDASHITGIVDGLEEHGLVERRGDPADRRVKQLVLTDEGRAVMERLNQRLRRGKVLDALSVDDRRTLRRILAKAAGPDHAHVAPWVMGPPRRRTEPLSG